MNANGSVKVSVYRKATHTDQYLDFHSHLPLEPKINVVRTLMHRAETTVTEPFDLKVVKEHIKSALKVRGYEDWISSNSCKEKTASSDIRRFLPPYPIFRRFQINFVGLLKSRWFTFFEASHNLKTNSCLPHWQTPQHQIAGAVTALSVRIAIRRILTNLLDP